MSDFEILFFTGVAIVIGYKLWSVLGRTNGDETARAAESAAGLAKKRAEKDNQSPIKGSVIELNKVIAEKEEEIPAALKAEVEAARKIDPTFSLQKFIQGASGAFELVVEGFAQKKRDGLKFLLSPDVYQGFESEIAKRDEAGLEASSSVVSLREPEVLDIELRGNVCQIVVKFISEQINFVTNKEGELVEGSKTNIDHVTESWTFERDLASKKPNWTIVGIQAA